MKHPRRTCSKPVRPLALVVVLGLGACAGTASRPLDPRPGAAGIGDPYYAELGNGGYDVQHYDLRLEVDMDSGVIEALATVTAVALHDLSSFNLDLYGLDVDAVTVDGCQVEFDREEQELIVAPARPIREGAEFVVAVAYGGVPEVVIRLVGDLPLSLVQCDEVVTIRETIGQARMREQHGGTPVFDQRGQPVRRVARIERQVEPARLERRNDRDDHVDRAFQADSDAGLRHDAELAKVSGQAVGAVVQLAVAQLFVATDQRDGVRALPGSGLEQLVYAL